MASLIFKITSKQLPLLSFIAVSLFLVFASFSAFAHSDSNFTGARQLIESNASCSSLSDEQLEEIGEYYMEQMHPGAGHELMHERMGLKEGTEAEEQFHINLARMMYCGEVGLGMGSGMMGSGMIGSGMTGQGMMQGNRGMMGLAYDSYNSGLSAIAGILWLIVLALLVIALFLVIIWLFKQVKKR